MKLHTLLYSVAVLSAAPLSMAADPPRNPFGKGDLPEILKPFDVDGDGKLSEEERQAYLDAVHDGQFHNNNGNHGNGNNGNPLDTDGDGKLSDAEKAAAQEAIRARILAQRSSRFDELDKDDDGLLTVDEFLGVPGIRPDLAARILKHLDTDKDGKISKEEFLAALRPPSPHGNGNGNGGAPPANPPAVPPAG
jgi:Ca2+-binding EF-hand superfamily protein